jgi:hypothetical protein
MKSLFYIHFNAEELKQRIEPLKALGLKIYSHASTEEVANLKGQMPDILIISLARLPSHGRRYAEWFW